MSKGSTKLGEEKLEELQTPKEVDQPVAPSDAELKKADAGLPIYDAEAALPEGEKMPDTPSGAALKKVGNLDGEDVDPDRLHDAGVHGEAYLAEKKKVRWG
jgi:hypothetical protein